MIHVSSVTTSSNGSSSSRNFCSYHSFGGVISSHDTKDCKLQKQGLTIVDPSNSKALKATGEHFTARARTALPNNSSGTKRKGNNGSQPHPNNPSGKPCWKCVKLQKKAKPSLTGSPQRTLQRTALERRDQSSRRLTHPSLKTMHQSTKMEPCPRRRSTR